MKRFFVLSLALVLALSLGACTEPNNGDDGSDPTPLVLDVQGVYEKMTQAAQLPEMMELDADQLLDFYGIKAEYVKKAVVVVCKNSLRVDEIWVIEAADSAAAQEVEKKAKDRIAYRDEETVSYSPEQNAVVKKAQILRQGNYIALIVSPDVEALAQAFRAEAGL